MNKEKNSGGRIRKPQHGRRLRWGKQFILLAAIAVLALGIVGGTSAYLLTNTGNVVNTFTPGKVSCKINENFEDGDTVKSNVTIENTSNTNAYIRAAIIVTWQDSSGNVSASLPNIGTDYSLSVGTDWVPIGGYYYYKYSVVPGNNTTNLITECQVLKPYSGDNGLGYTLHVEILADAIQSEPIDAIEESWKVTISNDTVKSVG